MEIITTMMSTRWAWPIAEVVHFTGLCLLFGTIALFDLRMLGVARGVPLRSLHRLIRFGRLGFALSVCSGLCFFLAFPDQYLYNPAMQVKLALIVLAGFNMALFYLGAARMVWLTPDDGAPPPRARIFGAISLLCGWG